VSGPDVYHLLCLVGGATLFAVTEYIDWFNYRRIHGEIGLIPSSEFKDSHRAHDTTEAYSLTNVPAGSGSK
jgi:putative transposase